MREEDVDTIGLWLSGKGVQSRLHYDRNGRHNLNAQLAGHKDFVIVPPSEFPKLYPLPMLSPIYNFTRVNNFDPDLEEHPLFAQVIAYRGSLTAGDLLFLPAFWYHSFTHIGEFNFNLNFWCDATVQLTAVALRNELATMWHASSLASGLMTDGSDPRWLDLARDLDRRCQSWSPRRATSDEARSEVES